MKLQEGNVFSCAYLFMEATSHVSITHYALELTVQGSPAPAQPYPPPASDIRWLLKHVRSARGRYASYWNTFLSYFPEIKDAYYVNIFQKTQVAK